MKKLVVLLAAALLGACANPAQEGRDYIAEGRVEEGLDFLERAALANPRDVETYSAWVSQRDAVVRGYVREGDVRRARGELEGAEAAYRSALRYDAKSSSAQAGLDALMRERRHLVMVAQAEAAFKNNQLDEAEKLVRSVLAENTGQRGARALMKTISERRSQNETAPPTLNASLKRPITLEFRDAPLRSVFEVISRSSGINFVFDRDVRQDLKATIFVRNSNLDDVIKLLLVTNQLDRKIVNDNSILVFPNTPAKQKEYQETVVRSFYLTNADPKQTAAMIRAMVKTRDLFVDEKLNLVVMKDTPDAVRLAEQLVATQDLGEPEVVLELEVMEVASNHLVDLGFRYPNQIFLGTLPRVDNEGSVIDGVTKLTGNLDVYAINPLIVASLRQNDGSVNTLANPRLRVRNREKAKVHIGEKVPVITTTSSPNVGVASSVSYLEVGLKLDVEPNVYLDDEVAMKVQLEVSNILEQLNVEGTVAYRLGTRNTSTVLRLRDGETQVLAGLINDEDRRAATKLPFLGDFPLLGRLFRSDANQRVKTEIVMMVTPRVVRNLSRPDTVRAQFNSGTETAPGSPPLRLGNVAPRSLALSASGGGGGGSSAGRGAPSPSATEAAAAAPTQSGGLALSVRGPDQVAAGSEFTLSLSLPASNEGAKASLQVGFDPAVLQYLTESAGSGADHGGNVIIIEAPAVIGSPPVTVQARFRVIAKEATTTQIRIDPLATTDAQGRPLSISVPNVHTLNISAAPSAAVSPIPPPPGIVIPGSPTVPR